MSITRSTAWAIFEAFNLGQPEAQDSIIRMTEEELKAYEAHAELFEMAVAQIGVEAQNEAAKLWESYPHTQVALQAKKPYRWTAEDYIKLVSVFEGSKYEQLHLSAQFRIQNNQLLLDLAKASL